ncbi:MAG TPA: STAS domain-containing protein [Acidimicrobiia bacterium]|nr:STAS domain-containing protein [Acidimicrobiia bacterium]
MQLQIDRSDQPGWAIISPAGEIDLATVGQLEDVLAASIVDGKTDVAVDLTGVTFMDSTGLRALLAANQNLSGSGHRLALVVAGGPVDRLLDISGVGQTLAIFQSLEAATA